MVGIDDVLEGRYRITKRLAEGGMGCVFLAQHLADKRRVAVKVLHTELATDVEVADCFLREARRAGQLGHANLVESVDVGYTGDRVPYVVFEYLKGSPLANEIGRLGGLAVARAIRIAMQIANGMHAAHEGGIVHRHLTSDNILVSDDPSPDYVKVIDFGSKLVGTPEAIAPEQVKNPGTVDRRADIYALGIILYEMLTGQRPKKGRVALDQAGIPIGLAELITDRMLAKDPAARPQTMSEVAATLETLTTRQNSRAMLRPSPRRPSESAPFPRGRVSLLDTAAHPVQPPSQPVAIYAILGLSVVLVALVIAWGLKSSTKTAVQSPIAEQLPPQPSPAAAAEIAPPMTVKPAAQVAVSIESDVPSSHVMFRRRVAAAPMVGEVMSNQVVELVEVSAPGYKTERYWLTLDRPTHLKAHLVKGTGLDEASEEATLVALGEHGAPEVVATAPIVDPSRMPATKAPVVAKAPPSPPTVAPRRIGRNAEPPPQVVAAVPETVAEAAPPPPAPPPPAPVAESAPAPSADVGQHIVAPAPVALAPIAATAPRNISPAAFKALRTSGNEEIAAPSTVAQQMGRDSKSRISAAVKACVSASGEVTQVSLIKSSGYPEYDQLLLGGVHAWRFKSGEAVCSAIAFAFKL